MRDELQIDLWDLLSFFKIKIIFIIVFGLICAGGVSYLKYSQLVQTYSAETEMYFVSQNMTYENWTNLDTGSSMQDYIKLVNSKNVLVPVIHKFDLKDNYKSLSSDVSLEIETNIDPNTQSKVNTRFAILTVTGTEKNRLQMISQEIIKQSNQIFEKKMKAEVPIITSKTTISKINIQKGLMKFFVKAAVLVIGACLFICFLYYVIGLLRKKKI